MRTRNALPFFKSLPAPGVPFDLAFAAADEGLAGFDDAPALLDFADLSAKASVAVDTLAPKTLVSTEAVEVSAGAAVLIRLLGPRGVERDRNREKWWPEKLPASQKWLLPLSRLEFAGPGIQ